MAELLNKVSQYIGFEPNQICLPITEEDRQVFRKIIANQEGMADIVMDEYQILLQHGHNNGKGGISSHRRFEEVPLAPVLIW
ncbi:10702_t:CDS:2 [Gigaspora margarita]|uniref:10702_t:CDS:1 n=1 Tax=Gigaspora margarita TaxID=4874 RepID=A0ABN7V6H7_GIGMA|nr:10702_t:CDS:2 [Gigaspora margarita]